MCTRVLWEVVIETRPPEVDMATENYFRLYIFKPILAVTDENSEEDFQDEERKSDEFEPVAKLLHTSMHHLRHARDQCTKLQDF